MSLVNLLLTARDGLAGWRRKHRAYSELMALDDRLLADIGINRSEVSRVVWGEPDKNGRVAEANDRSAELGAEPQSFPRSPFLIPRPF